MKNTFKLTLVIALIGVFSLALFATEKGVSTTAPTATMNVAGTVIDAETHETLVGVTVKIAGTDVEVKTDLDGNFTIVDLAPGEYILEVSYISYKESNFLQKLPKADNGGLKLSLEIE